MKKKINADSFFFFFRIKISFFFLFHYFFRASSPNPIATSLCLFLYKEKKINIYIYISSSQKKKKKSILKLKSFLCLFQFIFLFFVSKKNLNKYSRLFFLHYNYYHLSCLLHLTSSYLPNSTSSYFYKFSTSIKPKLGYPFRVINIKRTII